MTDGGTADVLGSSDDVRRQSLLLDYAGTRNRREAPAGEGVVTAYRRLRPRLLVALWSLQQGPVVCSRNQMC